MIIIQDLLPHNQQNRPSQNPTSSRYKIIIPPKGVAVHNAWSPWDAKGLNEYQKTGGAITRPASWHLSVDDKQVIQGIPFGETAWHAGDYVNVANPGVGNTQYIGMEICDFYDAKTGKNDQARYLRAEALSVEVVAYLINTIPSFLPFPECVQPHAKFRPASGCPSRILGRKDGWDNYISRVAEVLKSKPTAPPVSPGGLPVLRREIGIEVNGKMLSEKAYLLDNSTYIRALFSNQIPKGAKITGHGDHIKIKY